METEFLKRTEKAIEEEVERLVENVLDKIQHEYRADVAGFGNKLRIKYPHVWKAAKRIGMKPLVRFRSSMRSK